MKSIRDARYLNFMEQLRKVRKARKVTQAELAEKLGKHQSYVAKVEKLERRLDIIELHEWLTALGHSPIDFLRLIGWKETTDQGDQND